MVDVGYQTAWYHRDDLCQSGQCSIPDSVDHRILDPRWEGDSDEKILYCMRDTAGIEFRG